VADDGIQWGPEHKNWPDKPLTLLWCRKPFIFARNCNFGIQETGEDDVVLLNDDAILRTSKGFTTLQRVAMANPEYGIISAVTYEIGNRNQLPQRVGLREEKRVLCFVCVFIPRTTIERVGLMDERFGGYNEKGQLIYGYCDNDYSRRVREAGLKLGIYDFCMVDHQSLPSTFRAKGSPDLRPAQEIYRQKWGDLN
jgi:GT2 family glycosyltransferase